MKTIIIIVLGIVLAASVFAILKFTKFYKAIYTPTTVINSLKPKPEKTTFSILLLGYGGANHEGAYLTDTMMLAQVDTKKKKVTLISMPRDIWVKLPTKSGDDFHAKINSVYETELFPNDFPDLDTKKAGTKSDAELTKLIVSQITGIAVDNYISIDFESFTKAIDILGGVDINVQKSFDDEKYPAEGKEDDLCGKEEQFKLIEPFLPNATGSAEEREKLLKEKPELDELLRNATDSPQLAFPCRYEKIHFDAGRQHMDGATALKFVRSRQSPQDGGDFARAKRQQQLLEAVQNKILSVGFIAKIPSLLDEMEKYVKTDVSPETIQKLLKEAPSAEQYKITSIVLSDQNVLKNGRSENGQYILIPEHGEDQWKRVQMFIKNTIDEITPAPTRSPSLSPTP
ncbi:hypothetical protein A2866_01765 [Candidatus Roizmanbacteria bacterium RIFCSPHIGHO2_01_FULL_39_8]|uniref:Cell envelope-related transcriptional attenuator domain-containing protein n=2 Tax=Candidatus Roizmaniibacteriota TaxID=1752723 RepID=A0A1F7GL59_9BACT|nr:MAG: hypothetical protein A2866_01765 [Candidatus Roizmanbacteria bacterium RIFCSPHIGHO2_01_FULL_39_8]OGK25697.1 MAG: hypothetical protein A3C28_01535 [Candidatus Roizmanbacteria bacterium RIFCSPHIGHO2_02_FULL_39_9]